MDKKKYVRQIKALAKDAVRCEREWMRGGSDM
jgi:hypothetical protein